MGADVVDCAHDSAGDNGRLWLATLRSRGHTCSNARAQSWSSSRVATYRRTILRPRNFRHLSMALPPRNSFDGSNLLQSPKRRSWNANMQHESLFYNIG